MRGRRLGCRRKEIAEDRDLYGAYPTLAEQIKMLLERVQERISDLEEQRQALDVTLDELREIEHQSVDALKEKGLDPAP